MRAYSDTYGENKTYAWAHNGYTCNIRNSAWSGKKPAKNFGKASANRPIVLNK